MNSFFARECALAHSFPYEFVSRYVLLPSGYCIEYLIISGSIGIFGIQEANAQLMRQANNRLRTVGADSLPHADLIFAVCLNDTDPLLGDLDGILFSGFSQGKSFCFLYRRKIHRSNDFPLIDNFSDVPAASLFVDDKPYSKEKKAKESKKEEGYQFFMLSQEITCTFPEPVIRQRSARPEVTRTLPSSVIMIASN